MSSLFAFDNSFAREMEGFYVPLDAERTSDPKLLLLNDDLAEELGINSEALRSDNGVAILSGNATAEGSQPLAQAYAGHQFGGFSPSLGDGRALLLGEVIDKSGNRRDIQLKGSGRTPFSRNGDGKAALGPVLREYLMSEAMHAHGIPTTRSLAAVTTGDSVFRERPLPGAVLTRVASSHLRVGTFQFFAARKETEKVRQLADHAIARHDPDLTDEDDRYLRFLGRVIDRQVELVSMWMSIGFIHGVMNTDNMTVSGETIDYGPCAFMDRYDPETVFSSIDDFGRYAYKNQPIIAQWNLARLAEALLEILVPGDRDKAVELATEMIGSVPVRYEACWLDRMQKKLGIQSKHDGDRELIDGFHALMLEGKADFNLAFRRLTGVLEGQEDDFVSLFEPGADLNSWISRWKSRLDKEQLPVSEIVEQMNAINPLYVPRNHHVESALTAAVDDGDMKAFTKLLHLLATPFTEQAGAAAYETGAPEGSMPHVTFCGT